MESRQVFLGLSNNRKTDTYSEIFLPSYIESDFESLDRKREPVHEIILTDEEIEMMFPK